MATSYDKVCEHICLTPEWVAYEEKVRARLVAFKVVKTEFDVRANPHRPDPYFRVAYPGARDRRGEPAEFSVWRNARHEVVNYRVEWDHVSPSEDAESIAKVVWDQKKIPTYNCKFNKTEKGPREQNYVLKCFPILQGTGSSGVWPPSTTRRASASAAP